MNRFLQFWENLWGNRQTKLAPKRRTLKAPLINVNERFIDTIVIHHSGDLTENFTSKTIKNSDTSHKSKFGILGQPVSYGSTYPNIAYHYLITPSGRIVKGRKENLTGYHAGNWKVNQRSLSICVIGNYQIEKQSEHVVDKLQVLIDSIKNRYEITLTTTHNSVKNGPTDCCGKYLIKELKKRNVLTKKDSEIIRY